MLEPMQLSIGQVAERTGLSVHALRYYEKEGILAHQVHRGPGGRRVYTQQDVDTNRQLPAWARSVSAPGDVRSAATVHEGPPEP